MKLNILQPTIRDISKFIVFFFFLAWCTCSFFHLHLCLTLCLNNSELSQRCRSPTGGRNKLRLCARMITRVCWCFVVLFCFVFSAREVTFWHFVFNPSCLIKLDSCFQFTRILKGALLWQFPDVINEFRRSTSNNEHGLFCEMTPSLSCTGQFLFSHSVFSLPCSLKNRIIPILQTKSRIPYCVEKDIFSPFVPYFCDNQTQAINPLSVGSCNIFLWRKVGKSTPHLPSP